MLGKMFAKQWRKYGLIMGFLFILYFIFAVLLNSEKDFFDAVLFGHLQIILISSSEL